MRFFDYIRYNIPYGLKNLWNWFPLIWKHRDYDSIFTMMLLRKGLNDLGELISENDMHVNAQKDAQRIRLCVALLDRIISDSECGDFTYHDMVFQNHDRKWGELNLNFEEIDDIHSKIITNRPNVKSPDDEIQEQKECKNLYKHKRMIEEQDIDMLFNTLKDSENGGIDLTFQKMCFMDE